MKKTDILEEGLRELKRLINQDDLDGLVLYLNNLFKDDSLYIKPVNEIYQQLMDELLVEATYHNNIEVVKTLFQNFPLQPDCNYCSCMCLRNAISKSNMEVLKFLFFDKDVLIKPELHVKDDLIFEMVLNKNDKNFLAFFINECKIEKTPMIASLFKFYNLGETAEKLFLVRDLNEQLKEKPIKNNLKI